MQLTQRVAVIGGGVVGINTAYQLQKQGFDVTIFEPNEIASGASSGNAGHFATEQVFPLADPALLLQVPKMLSDPLGPFRIKTRYLPKVMPWFTRFLRQMSLDNRQSNTRHIKALNDVAIDAWKRVLNDACATELLVLKGSLLTFEHIEQDKIDEMLNAFNVQGVNAEFVSGKALIDLAPQLDACIQGAIYFTEVGHTPNPQALAASISDLFIRLGGSIISEKVINITDEPRPIVTTEQSDQAFDKIVICAGAFSKPLVKQLGYRVPLETERGYHLMLPIHVDLDCPIASSDRKFIMTPMSSGLRLAGTVEFGGNDAKPDYQRSDMLLTHAKAMLSKVQCPQLHELTLTQLNEEARWMGRRPSLPDSLPVMDRSPHNPSVFFNFGHQHLGLTWGAVCGELMAQLITNEHPSIDLTPYRITRF